MQPYPPFCLSPGNKKVNNHGPLSLASVFSSRDKETKKKATTGRNTNKKAEQEKQQTTKHSNRCRLFFALAFLARDVCVCRCCPSILCFFPRRLPVFCFSGFFCLLHLGVVARLFVEDCATGPRVAERQLAMRLAQRAASRAPREGNRHGERFRNAVLVDDLLADHDVDAQAADVGRHAHHGVALVGDAFNGFPLTGHCAEGAEAGVEALRDVHEARAEPGSPLARHFFVGGCLLEKG